MAKGYWIVRVDVDDAEGYKTYTSANGTVFKEFGARILVRGGTHEAAEGEARSRNVVIEFPDYATALAAYHSPEYQRLAEIRRRNSRGEFLIVEGYDGRQP